MKSLGYALQIAGLCVVAAGLVIGLARDAIAMEVALMLLGAAAFITGRALGGREG